MRHRSNTPDVFDASPANGSGASIFAHVRRISLLATVVFLAACGSIVDQPEHDSPAPAPAPAPAEFTGADIGEVGSSGYIVTDPVVQGVQPERIRVGGSGADVWGSEDSFFFAWREASGDFTIQARVLSVQETHEWAKAGLMVRSSGTVDATNLLLAATPGNGVSRQHRLLAGGETVYTNTPQETPVWLRLVREADSVRGFFSGDGNSWTEFEGVDLDLPDTVQVGLAVTSHARGQVAEALFESVFVDPERARIPSRVREPTLPPPGDTTPTPEDDTTPAPEDDTTPTPEDDTTPTPEDDTSPAPEDEPEADAPNYVGLHVTEAELAIWRDRAQNGPYRVSGDTSENSPGDWQRIVDQADRFVADPSYRRWTGNPWNRCYEWGDPAPEHEPSRYLRDAAFVYLVAGQVAYRDAVKAELLLLAQEPGLDLSDAARWCTGYLRDGNPGFEIANWFSQLLVAYDYLGDSSFTSSERELLDAWFLGAGRYFMDEVHDSLAKNFTDRRADDYRLTSYAYHMNKTTSNTSHYGGWDIYSLQRFYNNRRATEARFFGLVGIKLHDEELMEEAKRFVREYIAYGMFEDGILGDTERWMDRLPDLGWDYSIAALSSVITLADAFARIADFEPYAYSTTDGAFGTESSSPKSLLLAVRAMQSYLLPEVARYGTDSAGDVGDVDFRIDGKHAPAGWYSVADVTLLNANTYFRDAKIRAIYTREHPDVDPYPRHPASRGHAPAWNGDWGLYPGLLFMFGQTEDLVDPMDGFR